MKCPKCAGAIKVPGGAAKTNDDDQWLSLDEPLEPRTVRAAAIPAADPSGDLPRAVPVAGPSWLDDLPPLAPSTSPPRGAESSGRGADEPGALSAAELDALSRAGGLDLGADPWGDDSHNDAASARQSTKPNVAGGEAGEYRANCPVCESVHHVRPNQTGKTIRCGDCFSPFVVPPPPKVVVKKKVDLERAATFRLSAVEGERDRHNAPGAKSAAEYLRAAEEEELDEDPRRQYENPDVRGWLRGMFGIFTDPAVAAYWLALSMLGAIPGVLAVAIGHPMVVRGAMIASVLYSSLVLACAFAILESVANGNRKVDEWPVFNPAEWIGQYAVAIFAAALSALPGAVIGVPLFGLGLGTLALVMISVFLLFPFILLSMLDNGSPLSPISASVTKSVTRCKDAWGLLYFSSMLLFLFHFIAVAMLTVLAPPIISVFFSCILSVGLVFVYFSMVGQLAFAIGQAINAGDEDDEDSLP